MLEARPTSDWRPLALGIALVTAIYAVLYRFVPYGAQAYLLWPFGALALYSGARLRWWQALAIIFLVQMGTDLAFYVMNGWEMPKSTYLSFGLFVVLGIAIRPLLRCNWLTASAGVAGASIVGYALFFLITNAESWLSNSRPYYEPHTFATLMQAYAEGLEFLRTRPAQVFGNVIFTGLVFLAHAGLARAYFPTERFGVEPSR